MMDMMQPQAPGSAPQSSGYEICIAVKADGSMSVYQAALDANEAQGQPAASIGEALSAALSMYKQQSGDAQESGQDDFEAGFSDKPQQTERMQPPAMSKGAM